MTIMIQGIGQDVDIQLLTRIYVPNYTAIDLNFTDFFKPFSYIYYIVSVSASTSALSLITSYCKFYILMDAKIFKFIFLTATFCSYPWHLWLRFRLLFRNIAQNYLIPNYTQMILHYSINIFITIWKFFKTVHF